LAWLKLVEAVEVAVEAVAVVSHAAVLRAAAASLLGPRHSDRLSQ
jgi:broad specificity phosphatase PhoE